MPSNTDIVWGSLDALFILGPALYFIQTGRLLYTVGLICLSVLYLLARVQLYDLGHAPPLPTAKDDWKEYNDTE